MPIKWLLGIPKLNPIMVYCVKSHLVHVDKNFNGFLCLFAITIINAILEATDEIHVKWDIEKWEIVLTIFPASPFSSLDQLQYHTGKNMSHVQLTPLFKRPQAILKSIGPKSYLFKMLLLFYYCVLLFPNNLILKTLLIVAHKEGSLRNFTA